MTTAYPTFRQFASRLRLALGRRARHGRPCRQVRVATPEATVVLAYRIALGAPLDQPLSPWGAPAPEGLVGQFEGTSIYEDPALEPGQFLFSEEG